MDNEAKAIAACLSELAVLESEQRIRVFKYVFDRFYDDAKVAAEAKFPAPVVEVPVSSGRGSSPKAAEKRRPSKKDYVLLKDFDFNKDGVETLEAFYRRVQPPKRFPELHRFIIYYFTKIYGLESITLDHLFTGYKHLKMKSPLKLYSSLLQISSTTSPQIDTTDMKAIKLRQEGIDFVEGLIANAGNN